MTPSLSLKRFALTTFVVLLVVAPFILGRATAAPQLVTWGATQVVSKSPAQTNAFPTVDYDSNGKIHVAWIEYGSDPLGADSRVLYTNNVNGTWLSPFEVSSSGGRGIEPLVDLKVVGNELHFLYYTVGKQVAHRLVTLNGATPSKGPVTTMTSTKGGNPELAIDGNGNVHAFYISRSSDSAPYQIYHRIRTAGAWGSARIVRPDGTAQKFPAAVATSDGNIHLAFLGNGGDVVRYSIFGGSTWQASTDIASGKMKQLHITTDGGTIYAMYSAQPGTYHNVYFTQGGNGLWTTPVMLSSGGSYDENPFPYYDRSLNTLFAFWASGGGTSNTRVVVREYVPGAGFGEVVSLGGVAVQWPKAAGNLGSVSVTWEDKVTRTYDARLRTAGGIPQGTPVPTPSPTVVPVDFTFARTTGSPTKNANVGVSITNPQGSPNQFRYSLTPFTADNSALAWQALPNGGVTAFNVDTTAAVLNCSVTIYAQVRNSASGGVSPVRTVSAVVDQAIQSQVTLDPLELHPGAGTIIGQPDAPVGLDPDYTRNPAFYYRFTQEPAPCAGLKTYQLESNSPSSPTPFPNVVEGSTTYGAPNTSADTNGVGWPEQTLQANLTLTDSTDNGGNVESFSKTVTYDDDPPVLGAGGAITFTAGVSTNLSLVPIQFSASVTDDGYTNAAPATKKYWGVWVVATNSPTLPLPQVFAQYGKVHRLDSGATSLDAVNLTNDSPGMRQSGPRYVHMRFLDGAGNYSVAAITSPPIALNDPFVDGTRNYMPLISH
jgi:hypothetical protein